MTWRWARSVVTVGLGAMVACGDGAGSGGAGASATDGSGASTRAAAATTQATSGTQTSVSSAISSNGSAAQGTGGGVSIDPVLEEGWEQGDGAWTIEGPAALETDPARARTGTRSLRVDFRDPACGASSCNQDGNNCFENYPQVVSNATFDLSRYYVSWWVYYPSDFTFYDGPCMPVRGSQGHFVRFANFHTPHDPNDSFYQSGVPDFGQNRSGDDALGIRAEWQWIDNDSGEETIGRNLKGLPIPRASLVGTWNHYELYVDLGTVGGSDGAVAWSVNDVVRFDIHGDALHVGEPLEDWDVWGSAEVEAKAHPGLLRTSPGGFTRLGLVSNPNSSFGGRPGDVYWIDDLVIAEACPQDRSLCAPFQP